MLIQTRRPHAIVMGCRQQLDGAAEMVNSFLTSINAPGGPGRTLVVRDRLFHLACLLIVGCDLSGDSIQVRSVHRLQRLRHPAMQEPPPGGAQSGVGHLPDPVVSKVIGLRPLLAHDVTSP
jgi:hypothetical protein